MYKFIKNMWIMHRCDVEFIQTQVFKARISPEQGQVILGLPQIETGGAE